MSCRTTSGGSVSTSLARGYTNLTDKEIQHLFHALKREGEGMPAPSELDLAEWRDRQHQLIARAKRMTDAKAHALRSKLFRSRSEPVPDGPTFYAWSRVEARARQEVAIRSVTNAVDLEPPGSQAHLYELGDDGRPTKVWYASYGSNLHRDRLLTYIKGGRPPGSAREYRGCDDQSLPEADIPIRYAGARPHFALTSRVWGGGIAFLDAQKGETAMGLGRAYEVSISQFDQIVAQENGADPVKADPVPLDEALSTGRSVTGSGPYETMLHIGDYQGAPVITFTAPFSTKDATTRHGHVTRAGVRLPVMTNKPSPAYLRMIGSGLNETFGMDEVAQADYLRGCPGGDRYSRQEIVRILRAEEPPPDPARTTRTRETTPAFSSAPSARNGAEARAAADGAILADLRERGLFPADDTPSYTVTKRAVDPTGTRATTAGNRTEAPGRTTGGSGSKAAKKRSRKNRNAAAAAPAAKSPETVSLARGHFPGLKTYTCGEEQAAGVKTWSDTVNNVRADLREHERRVTLAERMLLQSPPTRERARYERTREESRHQIDVLTSALPEALAKQRAARAQTPATYYSPTDNRSLAAWKHEDAKVLGLHRNAETAHQQATRQAQHLQTRLDQATDQGQNDHATGALRDAKAKARRAERAMAAAENRLQEIYERIKSADT